MTQKLCRSAILLGFMWAGLDSGVKVPINGGIREADLVQAHWLKSPGVCQLLLNRARVHGSHPRRDFSHFRRGVSGLYLNYLIFDLRNKPTPGLLFLRIGVPTWLRPPCQGADFRRSRALWE
jgi:hypothetical protein